MYLACHSQEEIAQVVDVAQKTVANKIEEFSNLGNLAKMSKTHANHEEQLRNVTQLENAVFINDRVHLCSRTTLVSAIAQYLR